MRERMGKHPLGRYLLIGGIAGLFSGFFGVGGGIVMVPLLVLILGFDQKRASVHSLVAIIPTAIVASSTYFLTGTVPLDQIGFGLCIAIGSTVTAPLGTRTLRRWDVRSIRWIFLGALAVSSVFVFLTIPDRGAHLEWSGTTVVLLVLLGGGMGFLAGLLGIGGGILVVPSLILGFGVSDLTAKALSLVATIAGSVSGSLESHRAGKVDWFVGLGLGIPMAAVSPLGVSLATVIPEQLSTPLFAVLMVLAAIQLAVNTARTTSKA